jgi:hypothetical protein
VRANGGPYAAVEVSVEDFHYGGSNSNVKVFDLLNGRLERRLGGESAQLR